MISRKAPLTVQFLDRSQNNPDNWKWDFGGGSSKLQNPSHIYIKAGKTLLA